MTIDMKEKLLERLEKANAARREKLVIGEAQVLNHYQKAVKNPASLPQAIKATCFDCMGRSERARDEIAICSGYSCSLWPHRPYQNRAPAGFGLEKRAAAIAALEEREKGKNPLISAAKDESSRVKAVHAHCYDCMGGDAWTMGEVRDLIATCKSDFPVARDATDNPYCGCPLWPHRRWKTKSPSKLAKNMEKVAV